MGQVKPGYGPKTPPGYVDPPGKGEKPAPAPRPRGVQPQAEKAVTKGMAVNPAIVRSQVDAALATSKALRAKRAAGDPGHAENAAHNQAMAELQQSDSLAHSSVLAIHLLESQISEGKETKNTRTQLKQANANLRARLAQGATIKIR